MTSFTQKAAPPAPGFADLYTPKLVTVLREGYGLGQLRADAIAGLTVAIVALPLSIAIAVASGASPAQGLITAIIGGFLVSALGGSRFQIGGPAGAFIVLVSATVMRHGIEGLVLATFLSGLMLAVLGMLRLGVFVKHIPYPVTLGFTAGIGVSTESAYPAQLARLLEADGYQAKVVNAGIKGETVQGSFERVAWLLQQRFDIFVLATGWDDLSDLDTCCRGAVDLRGPLSLQNKG